MIQKVMNNGTVENIDIAKELGNKLEFVYDFRNEGDAVVTVVYDHIYTAEFICHILPVEDSDLPRLFVMDASGSAGHTVQMTISVKNNPGFGGMNLSYIYDKTSMTLVEVINHRSEFTMSHNSATILDAADNWYDDGDLVTLIFKLNSNAKIGKYEVAVVVNEAYEYTDTGLDVVDFYTVNGNLSVVDLVYGDANSDGVVNTMDIMLIRRHLAARDPITGISTTKVSVGADANGDGIINTMDLILARKHVAAKDPLTGESSVVLGPSV